MKKISRYILVLITILAAAVALPNLYWLAFEKPISVPFIMYSSLENDFFIIRNDDGTVRTDTKGNEYTRDEFEQKLPLFFARQLVISGTMPDSMNGVEMDIHTISRYRSSFRLRAKELFMPDPGLYPLFESESGRANLELPLDYFRIKDRMEFVDAQENKVMEQKSQMFTTVLNNRDFKYPAKLIAGIPTTRKSCDEGYFVIDDADYIYHVKMIEGEPYVRKVDIPEGISFRHISCVDFSDKKFYCYLIAENNDVYILTQDDYEFIRLPIDNYDPEKEELRIYGSMFHFTAITRSEGHLQAIAFDTKYNKVDKYEEVWPVRNETRQGKVAGYIFPAELSLTDSNKSFNDLYLEKTPGFKWLILNLLLVLVQFIIVKRCGLKVKRNILDFAVVALTGIYGFIAVNFFQNKFFD